VNALARWMLGGLFLGGIIHILTILLLPTYVPVTPADRVAAAEPAGRFTLLGPDSGPMLAGLDPSFVHAVCPLTGGTQRLTGRMPGTLWTFAIVDGAGAVSQSFTDASALNNGIDVLVAPRDTLEAIRFAAPPDYETTLLLDQPPSGGFVLLRAYAPSPADAAEIGAVLETISCAPFEVVLPDATATQP